MIGHKLGHKLVDDWIYRSFTKLKLSNLSSWGMFEGENKCFNQGTILLHEGEDGAWEISSFCALVGSPGASELTPWLPGVGIPFPGGFFLLWSLLWLLGLFLLPGNLAGLPVWNLKVFSPSFISSLQYTPGLWDSCLVRPRQSVSRS